MNPMPDFLILGAAKAGTSALYAALGQHPQIFCCRPKEPRFFAFENTPPRFGGPRFHDYVQYPTITRLAEYQALFAGSGGARARGEASTVYSYHPSDRPAEAIRRHLPEARLILLLRQPADRAYSNFTHAVRADWEPLNDFPRALADEPRRIAENWSYFLRYRHNSGYVDQLRRYLDRFERGRILIRLYDDLCRDFPGLIREIFRFLEVDDSFEPDLSRRPNRSFLPRNRRLHRLLNRPPLGPALTRLPRPLRRVSLGALNRANRYRPVLDPDLRQHLTAAFRNDILRLEELIDRDLSAWQEPDHPSYPGD